MDIEKAKSALKNAHAAGDIEAAKKIANFLKSEATKPTQQGDAGGALRAAAYGFTGGSIPFGNVISSGIGAGIAKAASPFTGDQRSLGELYTQAQADTRATQEANPVATFAGNMTGIAATVPLAFSKALGGTKIPTEGIRGAVNAIPKIGNFVGSSTLKAAPGAGLAARTAAGTVNAAVRGVKGAAVAAPAAFAYGAGDADPGRRIEAGSNAARNAAYVAGGLAAGLPVTGAALGAAAPKIDEGVKDIAQLARKYGIPLSFDQISNSRPLKNMQKVSQEIPFSGQAGFREKQIQTWQNRILKTIGLDANKFTKSNMDKAFSEVGAEFDNLGKGKTFQLDDNFSRSLDAIRQDAAGTATKDSLENFNYVIEKIVLPNADETGTITGEKLGKVRAEINRLARKSNNADTQDLLHDLENAVIDVMTEGDDLAAGAFSATKQKYKNLLVIEPLAAKAKGGNISPSLLNSRVSKIYGRAHTRGQAGEIGDLAQIGYELLPELGGSDTFQKTLYGAGGLAALGGVIANPAVGVPAALLGGAGVVGNRVAQSVLNRNQKLIDKTLTLDDVLLMSPKEASKVMIKKKKVK